MLSEQSGTPLLLPWVNAPGGSASVAWVSGISSASLSPGGAMHVMLDSARAIITPTIYDTLLPPLPTVRSAGGFRWMIDAGTDMAYSQFAHVTSGLAGQYMPATDYAAGVARNAAVVANVVGDPAWALGTFIHEFAHHVDYSYGDLWPGSPHDEQYALSFSQSGAPFNGYYNAALPEIPSPLYGRTNAQEWFAELFACQVVNGGSGNRHNATLFLQLCGSDLARARAVRAAFKALLPMPGTFAYD